MLSIKERDANTVQAPEADTKILFLDAADSKLKTKDSSGVLEEISITDGAEPKVYVALLSQSGTDAPVATVLENTLGGEVVWSRTGVGLFRATLAGAFVSNKTFFPSLFIDQNYVQDSEFFLRPAYIDVDSIAIINFQGGIATTDNLGRGYVEIRVYP